MNNDDYSLTITPASGAPLHPTDTLEELFQAAAQEREGTVHVPHGNTTEGIIIMTSSSHSHSWLTVGCTLLSVVAFLLGLAGLWPTYGPSLMCGLFLIAAGPVIAFGRHTNVEATGLRTLAIIGAVACGLVFSSFLDSGLLQSPQDAGAGATGGFMFFAALGMWLAIRKMQRNIPELIEGLNTKIALSTAAAAGSFGVIGLLALALFCTAGLAAGLWFRAKGRKVDTTGLFASCSLVLLGVLAGLPYLVSLN